MQEKDLLGSPDLHSRLCLSSCILAELLRQYPAAVGVDGLVRETDHPREEVEAVCRRLNRNGLLSPDAGGEGYWRLACDPGRITLAELFSALLAEQS